MPTCHTCGGERPDGARFCAWCGAAVLRNCDSCGVALPAGAGFCPSCGIATGPQLLAAATTPATERRVVTVLFVDVADSTALAEHLDPEVQSAVMSRYFDTARAAIESEGGTVEKFIGDAVMAAFGVPVVHEDDAERALRAATAVQHGQSRLNDELQAQYGVSLALRIGVNSGDVVAHPDAAPGEALVTGDSVNVAARLQVAADPGEVLVAERTARAVRGFEFGPGRAMQVRGRQAPVVAFPLIGGDGGGERGVPGLWAPMIGRDGELEMLATVLRRVRREGCPAIVTVFGEAGVGKSRLVRDFLQQAALVDEDLTLMQGRCLPYGDGITFAPLAQVISAEAGITDSDEAATALTLLRQHLQGLLAEFTADEVERITQALATMIGLSVAGPQDAMEPLAVRREVRRAVSLYLSAVAALNPTVLVVEDIHWADPALLDLLEEVVEQATGPVLLVCPSRPDLIAERPGWGGGRRNSTTLMLDPLGAADADRLVSELLTVDDLPASVHRRILERAEGNPFFLEEILRQMIDTGAIVKDGGRWRAEHGIEQRHIPDTVQGVIAARLSLLDAADKSVLQAAAVVGRTFWLTAVTTLTGLDGQSVEDALRRASARDLVVFRQTSSLTGDAEFHFRHVLISDVAYGSLPRSDRATAHVTVGHWLEQAAGDRIAEVTDLLAHHYAAAADLAVTADADTIRRSAVGWLLRASDAARRKHALRKATRLAERARGLAVSDLEICDSEVAIASAYDADVRGDLAWRHFRLALDAAERSDEVDELRLAGLTAKALEFPIRWPGMMSIDVDESICRRLLHRGLQVCPVGDSPERASLLALQAGWPFAYPEAATDHRDDYAAAGLAAADMAARLGDADLESAALDAISSATGENYVAALAPWLRRWELRDRLTSQREREDMYAVGAWNYWELARFRDAVAVAEAFPIDDDVPHSGSHLMTWMTLARFSLGEWDSALAAFDRVRASLGRYGDTPVGYAVQAYITAAQIHTLRGNSAEARRLLLILDASAQTDLRIDSMQTWLAVLRDDWTLVRRLLGDHDRPWPVHEARFWQLRCDSAIVNAEWADAATVAGEARGYASATGSVLLLGFAARLDGARHAASGRPTDAADAFRRAAAEFTAREVVFEAARTSALLAEVLAVMDDRMGSQAAAADALAVFDQLGVRNDSWLSRAIPAIRPDGGRPER